jgi:hypothetical protein
LLRPLRDETARDDFDVLAAALRPYAVKGETTFVGHGQGRSPRAWRKSVAGREHRWMQVLSGEQVRELVSALGELPDQDAARADPVYRLVAFG